MTTINTILAIQMNIFMLILLSCIAVHACFRFNQKKQAHRLFLTLIFSVILILLLEIASVVLNSAQYIEFMVVHKIVNVLGFLLTPVVPIIAAMYAYKRANKARKIPADQFPWLKVPFIVNGILSVGSYYFNWIFTISAENLYVRGPLFFVSPVTSYFYYIMHLSFLYKNRKKISREELFGLSCLTLIPAVFSVFQLYYYVFLTIWNSVAIAVVINYIFIVYNEAKYDPLTGVGNRIAYDEYLANLQGKSGFNFSVVNIDLDDFKSINDLYGHQEGDKVLKVFARNLEDAFEEEGVVIRLGGDEFIVLLRERRISTLERCIRTFNDKINAYNASKEVRYCIQFSYGIATYDNSFRDINTFIQYSDKLMYEEKQKKKR